MNINEPFMNINDAGTVGSLSVRRLSADSRSSAS